MDLASLRVEIDAVDAEIVNLFEKRLKVLAKIGNYKKEQELPVLDAVRERNKLDDIKALCSDDLKPYIRSLYTIIFDIGRDYQLKNKKHKADIMQQIFASIEGTPKLFPQEAEVICQGTWGAYSQLACDKMITSPKIMYAKTFDGVFSAIDKGLCSYGVLPLENSTAGSVNQIYDLMHHYKFHIVRCTRVKIDHNLLVRPGGSKANIREIISHEQALTQCEKYLKKFPDLKITVCENTAIAAEAVAKSGRNDLAALASSACIELYGLECLEASVQDSGNNYTRFICISKKMEIYPGADKTSLMMRVAHKPGALYKILSRFFLLGINLTKLESRPLADCDFEFMFYFDIETSVYSASFMQLMNELDSVSEDFRYLGSYSEVI